MLLGLSIRKSAAVIEVSVKISFYMRHKILDCLREYIGIGSKSTEQVHIDEKLTFTIGTISITLYDVEVIDDIIHGAIEDSLCGLIGADVIYAKKWSLDYKSSHFKITN